MGVLSLRLKDEVLERLNRLATVTGRTKTYHVTEAICGYLDESEDLYLTETRWHELQEGYSKTIPLAEIADQYILAD